MSKSLAFKGWVLGVIILLTFIPFKISNIMVAMASILLVPELAKDDYTEGKFIEVIKLVVICSVLSFCASIFSYHIYIGTALTFIITFLIYYFYTYDNKESKSMIFMIYYILILSIPMPKGDLGYRMMATVYGAVIAMVLYYLVLRLDFLKIANTKVLKSKEAFLKWEKDEEMETLMLAANGIQEAEELLIRKSEKLKKNKFRVAEKIAIIELIKALGREAYKGEKEKLVSLIKEGYNLYFDEEREASFYKSMDKTLGKYRNEDWAKSVQVVYRELKSTREMIELESKYLEILNRKRKVLKEYSDELKLNYRFKISMKNIKFNAAIKGAILTSIAVFVVFYFNLTDGRWLLYTITVVYLPFADQSIKKLIQRCAGTGIGFIVFDILLSISQNNIYIVVLILVSLYFSIYTLDYGKRAIFITYTGIASQYLINKSESYYVLSLYRIGYVVLGALIAFLVINYIFKINFKNSISDIEKAYELLNLKIKNKENGTDNIKREDITILNKYLYLKSSYIYKLTKNERLREIMDEEIKLSKPYKII